MSVKDGDPTCQICGLARSRERMLPAHLVRSSIADLIRRDHPQWDPAGFICFDDLNRMRALFAQEAIELERGEVTELEAAVVRSLAEHEIVSRDVAREFEQRLALGDRLADRVARVGGSWSFVAGFAVVIALWVMLNSSALLREHFDPYPYILLNLLLSCLAAIQAPVIMMSQNRKDAKDRARSENDYRVNLKAELEIRHLSAKLDQLLIHQWERLLEIQSIQMEMMDEVLARGNEARQGA